MAIGQGMARLIADRARRVKETLLGQQKKPKTTKLDSGEFRLPEEGSEQYLRARKALIAFFEKLPYQDGQKLYLALGQKDGFDSPLKNLLRRVGASGEMVSQERVLLKSWVDQEVRRAWKYYRDLRGRKQEAQGELFSQ